jgi:fluoroacetyl-CoA thioesterase
MLENVQVGLSGTSAMVVGPENTARRLGSGRVDVLATPELVRLMEQAAVAAVDHLLPEGWGTVGTRVDVQHLAATPPGVRVEARAELVSAEGRRLTFAVEARDERQLVGRGHHERVAVELARFQKRL